MSSYVDATPEAGAQAVEEADRPPPPSHRWQRSASIDGTTSVLPDPTRPIPTGDGATWHRRALLATSLAPDDEPPFLTEPTVAVPSGPPAALGQKLSELAYPRRAIAAVAVAALVLAAALVSRGGSGGEEAEGPPSSLADGGAALMEPVRAALAAFGSTSRIAPSVASGSAGSAGVEASTTVPEPTTTTAEPTAVPSTAPVPAEVPGTVQPRFCTVWVDGPLRVLAEPDDGAAVAGQVGIGLYWVSAVTEDRPRWYLIDNGEVRGWALGEDVDRQGDCRGRR